MNIFKKIITVAVLTLTIFSLSSCGKPSSTTEVKTETTTTTTGTTTNVENNAQPTGQGMTPPNGMTMPDGTTPPNMPEGMTPPNGMTMPDGATPPNMPEGMTPPDGFGGGNFNGNFNGNFGGFGPGMGQTLEATEYVANTPSRDITQSSYDAMPEITQSVKVVMNQNVVTIDGVEVPSSGKGKILDGLVSFKYEDGLIKINTEDYAGNLEFEVTGTLNGYGIQVKSSAKYVTKIVLNNTNITSTESPCLVLNTKNVSYVVLKGVNNLTDGRKYGTAYGEDYSASGDNSKGTIYAKGGLVFSGDGSLTINEEFKHGIASKDYIKINGGTFTINSSGRNGFQAVNGFILNDGNITINGTGTHTNNESRGIVVEGSEDNPGEGFIVINGGTINITTVSKGITAKWDADLEENDGDATDSDTTNDPYPYVRITAGTINITTTGTPKEGTVAQSFTDADGETVSEIIKLSPEGIEGKQSVFIEGGSITLNCTDDCINSSREGSGVIKISGGDIFAYSSNNDAIDSNGTLTISGGTVVAFATTVPECAFDCDMYRFSITGGTVVGIGTSNYSEPTADSCTQGVLVLASNYLPTAGKTVSIKDDSGSTVFSFKIPTSVSINNGCVGIFSSSALTNSGTYSVSNGQNSMSGISFAESYVYTAGTTNNMGAREGVRPMM